MVRGISGRLQRRVTKGEEGVDGVVAVRAEVVPARERELISYLGRRRLQIRKFIV